MINLNNMEYTLNSSKEIQGKFEDNGEIFRPLQFTPEFLKRLRLGRRDRLCKIMKERGHDALILCDPVNIRYATGARNMQVFHLRNPVRYLLILEDGTTILFESDFGNETMTANLGTINEICPPVSTTFTSVGEHAANNSEVWASEMSKLLRKYGVKTVGIERVCLAAMPLLEEKGFCVKDALEVVEIARSVKNLEEITVIREAVRNLYHGIEYMKSFLRPGISENMLWSHLHQWVIANGGEWIETRLLSSGLKTNPWFQECGSKIINSGELVALDSDTVGTLGYYVDFSRTFFCPGTNEKSLPTTEQKKLYDLAVEQVRYNISLIRPGLSFRDFSRLAWNIPAPYQKNRYHVMTHGVGMSGEYPYIYHYQDYDKWGIDGLIEENMTLCVESFIGHESYGEGVKFEEQVLVTSDGVDILTSSIPTDPLLDK